MNQKDFCGQTSLHWACKHEYGYEKSHGCVEIFRLLIYNGANINVKDKYDTISLHLVCRGCSAEVICLIVNKGSNINKKDINGQSPLRWACGKGCVTIVKHLLLSNCLDYAGLGVQSAKTSNKDMSCLLHNASQPWRSNTEISAMYPLTFQKSANVLKKVFFKGPKFNFVARVNKVIVELVLGYCSRAWF